MRDAAGHWRGAGIAGYDVVRIVLGLVLLSAAALKGHQLATEPVAETSLFTSRWFLIGGVEFELFFGLWLWFGLYPRRTWQLTLLCFSAFASVSLYKALSGGATCGCFGRVPVNPWYTLVLDLGAVTALLWWRPVTVPAPSAGPIAEPGASASSPLSFAGEGLGVRAGPRRQLACVLGISLLVGLPAARTMASYQPASLDEAGDIFGDGEFVVLEPEKWVGDRFPLFDWVDIGGQLAQDAWILVLYHVDCPKCEELIVEWEQAARDPAAFDGVRVAFIEVPQPGAWARRLVIPNSACALGRLSDAQAWFVSTPTVVLVEDGLVKKVCGDGDCESSVHDFVRFGRKSSPGVEEHSSGGVERPPQCGGVIRAERKARLGCASGGVPRIQFRFPFFRRVFR